MPTPPRRIAAQLTLIFALALITGATSARAQADYSQDLVYAQEHHKNGSYDNALPLLEGVLQAIDDGKLSERDYLGRCLTPLVDIYFKTGRYEAALPLAERQLKWFESEKLDRFGRRRVLEYQIRLGKIHALLNQRDQARAAWIAALKPSEDRDEVTETLRFEARWLLADTDPNSSKRQVELTRVARALRQFRAKLQALDRNQQSTELVAKAARIEALCFASLNAPAEAAVTYRDLLARLEKPLHPDYLSTLVQLAAWEREAGELENSEQHLQLAFGNKRFTNKPEDRAAILEQLGLTLKQSGKSREARQCWQLLLEAESKLTINAESPVAAQLASLSRLRTAHEELRQLPLALKAAQQYADLLAKQPHATADERRRALDVLGALCVATGDYPRAEKLLTESLQLTERDSSAPPDALAKTRTNLANLYRKLARADEAEALFETVLADYRRALKPGDLPLAEAQSNVAAMLTERGRFAEAIALLREALAGAEKAGPRGDALRASLLQFLAVNYLSQGQLDRAAEQLRAAIALESAAPTRNAEQSRASIERSIALARIELARGNREAAAKACEQALALAEDGELQGDPVQSALRRLAGDIAFDAGNLADAEKYWLAALDAEQSRRAGADAARTLADLGDLAVQRRQFAAAEKYYRRALDQQADVFNLPILHYNILGNLGQLLYYWKDDRVAGLELLKQAADLLEIPRAATAGGGEQERAKFLARHSTVFDLLVDNSLASGNVADAFHYAERARNRTFVDQLQLAGVDLRETLPAESADLKRREQELATRLSTLRTSAANAAKTNRESPDAKRLADEVRALQDEYFQVWSEIRDASPFYREVLQQRLDIGALADVQREAIPADAQMLFYVLGDFQSHLLVIGHEPNDVTAFELVLPESLQAEFKAERPALTRSLAVTLVDEYLAALRNVEGGRGLAGVTRSPKGLMAADRGQAVTEIFLPAAVRKRIAERAPDHVIVVPDGALHELPLGCLVISPGERPVFALDTLPPLTYAPSATILQSLVTRPVATPSAKQPRLLSVGNPRYDDSTAQQETSLAVTRVAFVDLGGSLSPLPGTAEECRRAANAFGAGHSTLLLADDATETAVRRGLAGPTYIHLAAHGLVDERDDNLFGAIALTPPSQIAADDDGFLSLHEIYALDLGDCELAALSACQTNVGGKRPLEAGSTLARAFLAAGARRVVCSQWNVDDEAGAELMALFWEEIATAEKEGRTIHYARALRDAQRRIRQQPEFASAYYWAPYVLIGPADAP